MVYEERDLGISNNARCTILIKAHKQAVWRNLQDEAKYIGIIPFYEGLCGVTVSALGSQPRGPGFDPREEWKNLGGFSDTLMPLFT